MTHAQHVSEPIELSEDATVGGLVAAVPGRSRIFEQLGIDYCCGGKLPLADACRKKGFDPHTVVQMIAAFDSTSAAPPDETNPTTMTLTALAAHIEQTHHAYLRGEFPRLDTITEKVARVHGEHDPRLVQVRQAFVALAEEMLRHMAKEEHVLFPMIRDLETSQDLSALHCGSLSYPIRQMESEHNSAGGGIALMRELTDGFTPPAWACNTYRAMLDALAQLERDLHLHVHKENNVLFPRALELERTLETQT
jgi:regulator of cell morphogenesis and NO signaling